MTAYPSSPPFATCKITSIHQTLVSKSQSGKRFARAIPGHQWAFTAAYSNLMADQFRPLMAFAVAQRGSYGTFTVVPPRSRGPSRDGSRFPLG